MRDLIGSIIDNNYRVDAFIESGGMGAVYRVWDLRRNVVLAMKVLHDDLADDPSIFARFEREANALKKLAHPNIVPFYGIRRTSDFAFILERYIDGPSLKDILKEKKKQPLPIQEALIYLKAICAALGYAHTNNVVHCDVKPGNIIIDQGGNIYLTDFGVARHSDSTKTALGMPGTPAYMAPEQILGKPVTPATDVYSLSVMLFEMLTGQRPFHGSAVGAGTDLSVESVHERIRYSHLHLTPPDPRMVNASIPSLLAEVILKGLSKEVSLRYPSANEFFGALCDAIGISVEEIADRVPPLFSSSNSFEPNMVHADFSPSKQKANGASVNQFTEWLRSLFANIFRFLSLIIYGVYYVVLYIPFLGTRSFYIYLKRAYLQYFPGLLEKNKNEEDLSNKLLAISDYAFIIPIDGAYEDVQNKIFLGRDKELKQFFQHLYSSRGGAFCLSGFRGVGKTKFLERVIDLLRSRVEDTDGKILVDIWLPLPQSCTPKELMHIIVASLIRRLHELGIFSNLGRNLESQLRLISKRLSKTIRSSVAKNVEIGGGWGDVIKPAVSFGRQDEEEFLPYEASLAQQDVISILRAISSLSISRNFKQYKLRVVFVFDEMDKIDELDALVKMLRSLKTLFNESATSFIFVLGADQFKMMLADENEGLASKFDMYIPCLWGETENILAPVVKGNSTHSDYDSIFIYQNFLKYLSFVYRGIPRRLWTMIRKHTFEDGGSVFLGFSNKDVRKFRFYSEVEKWLSQRMGLFLLKKPNLSDLDHDLFKMSIYTLSDSILKSQGEWFTVNDVLNAFSVNNRSVFSLSPDFVTSFLNDFTKSEYLEKREDEYRLEYRRYVELGEAKDDILLTGDFRVKGSLQEDDVSKYNLDEDKTELGNFGDLSAIEPTSWMLLAESTDNKLAFRLNDQRCALIKSESVYDKCDIGRAANNDVELKDEEVSRYHARLIHSQVGWQIIDMNTANGTFVDGIPVSQPATLVSGSIITIGKTNIFFKVIS